MQTRIAVIVAAALLVSPVSPSQRLFRSATAAAAHSQCKGGKVWDKKQKKCVAPKQGMLDDDSIYEAGRDLAMAGRYGEAITLLGLAADKTDPRILNYLGYSHRKAGRIPVGLGYYQEALRIDPDYTLVREYLGEALSAARRRRVGEEPAERDRKALRHRLQGIHRPVANSSAKLDESEPVHAGKIEAGGAPAPPAFRSIAPREMRMICPSSSSVTSQIAPSGATLTSRMRPKSPSNRRCSLPILPLLSRSSARQQLELQRADQQIALPFREHFALVDGKPRRRDRRIPVEQRLLIAGRLGADADLLPGIVHAVGDHRPAIVLAGLGPIDLVAALGAVLDGEQPLVTGS